MSITGFPSSPRLGANIVSKVNMTSSAVISTPSLNFTPSRRLNEYVFLSSDMLHDFARAGIGLMVNGSTVTSGERIRSTICDE